MAVSFLMEETGVPRENHRTVASHLQILSHNVVSSTPRPERGLNSQIKSLYSCLKCKTVLVKTIMLVLMQVFQKRVVRTNLDV
jgi:hypothetical protein